MIPKIIHYCWFGGNPLPDLAVKCIESWKKFLPDYKIQEWNESNYDVYKITYIAQAYDAQKYAFVSDFARFDILYKYGGLYFDTDVEVLRPMDEIIERGAFCGVECAGALNAGLGLGSPAASPIYREILDSYENSSFIKSDGTMDLTTVVKRVSDIFCKHGFTGEDEIQCVAGITIYPTEYFCPKDYITGEIKITENTCTIHHYDGSWLGSFDKRANEMRYKINYKVKSQLLSRIIYKISIFFLRIKWFGIQKSVQHYLNRIKR